MSSVILHPSRRASAPRSFFRPSAALARAASSEDPIASATSAYGRSSTYRWTTAARCMGGGSPTARQIAGSPSGVSGAAGSGSLSTGTGRRALARQWSSALRVAIVRIHPAGCRRSAGSDRRAAPTGTSPGSSRPRRAGRRPRAGNGRRRPGAPRGSSGTAVSRPRGKNARGTRDVRRPGLHDRPRVRRPVRAREPVLLEQFGQPALGGAHLDRPQQIREPVAQRTRLERGAGAERSSRILVGIGSPSKSQITVRSFGSSWKQGPWSITNSRPSVETGSAPTCGPRCSPRRRTGRCGGSRRGAPRAS